MRKFMFCAGGYKRQGWESFDKNVDISKRLPFPNGCASHVHTEHGVEHITHQQAWNFLEECHRVLAVGGRIRIAIPDIEKIWIAMTNGVGNDYAKVASKEGTYKAALKACVFNHGHQAAWTGFMLYAILQAIGFQEVEFCDIGQSKDREMRGLEQHGKTVGEAINAIETTVVEGVK